MCLMMGHKLGQSFKKGSLPTCIKMSLCPPLEFPEIISSDIIKRDTCEFFKSIQDVLCHVVLTQDFGKQSKCLLIKPV